MRVTIILCASALSLSIGCGNALMGEAELAVKNAEIEAQKDAMCKVTDCEETDLGEHSVPFDSETGCESYWGKEILPWWIDPDEGVCHHPFRYFFWELLRVEAGEDGTVRCVYRGTEWSGSWTAELEPDDTCPEPPDEDGTGDGGGEDGADQDG